MKDILLGFALLAAVVFLAGCSAKNSPVALMSDTVSKATDAVTGGHKKQRTRAEVYQNCRRQFSPRLDERMQNYCACAADTLASTQRYYERQDVYRWISESLKGDATAASLYVDNAMVKKTFAACGVPQ